MNLEDRLRSHMHSGDDLFVETGRDAGAIAATGRRRTRRNQIGGAAAGGMLALGLVFGVSTQIDRDEPQDFAIEVEADPSSALPEASELRESDVAESDMPESDLAEMDLDDASTNLADGFVTYEHVIGVGEGFAGLRATDAGIVAIRSDDGIDWAATPTTGIPDRSEITSIEHDGGVFAAPFVVFDEVAGSFTSYIGTSTDLTNWDVEALRLGENFDDPYVNELAIANGEVIAVVLVGPPLDETSAVELDPSIVVFRGPVGGPYESTELPEVGFGVSELTATDDAVMFVVISDTGSRVWSSRSGGPWSVVRETGFESFPTLAGVGSSVYVFDGSGVERSSDAGVEWERVDVDGVSDYTGATAISSGDTLAALFSLASDDGLSAGYVLAAGPDGGFEAVPTDDVLPDDAFVLLAAVNAEEVLVEVFPGPDGSSEDFAASSGIVDVEGEGSSAPRYVRIPLG